MLTGQPEPQGAILGVGVNLRPTSEHDLELLTRWFARPDVNRYWGGRPLSIEEVAAKYIGRRRPTVECFVVEVDDTPAGWIQYHVDGDRHGGIDLVLLAEHRRRGVGAAAVHSIVGYLLDELKWSEVTVDPAEWNEDGTRFWAAVGFVPAQPRTFPIRPLPMSRKVGCVSAPEQAICAVSIPVERLLTWLASKVEHGGGQCLHGLKCGEHVAGNFKAVICVWD